MVLTSKLSKLKVLFIYYALEQRKATLRASGKSCSFYYIEILNISAYKAIVLLVKYHKILEQWRLTNIVDSRLLPPLQRGNQSV